MFLIRIGKCIIIFVPFYSLDHQYDYKLDDDDDDDKLLAVTTVS